MAVARQISVIASVRRLFAFFGGFEHNGDVSPIEKSGKMGAEYTFHALAV